MTTRNFNVKNGLTAGTITLDTATGNATANYFIGNGSALTGITASQITGVTTIANGTTSVSIPVAAGNVIANVGGTANVLVLSTLGANVTGTLTANNVSIAGATSGIVNVAGALGNLGLRSVATTYTDSAVTGTQANAAIHYLATPTITGGTNAKTYTNMATLYIAGNVTAGTNATITNNYAMFIGAGNSFFGGNIIGTLANGNSSVNMPAANGNINLIAVGNTTLIVTGTGVNVSGTSNVTGTSNTANLNVSGLSNLGAVGNVTITGGSSGQYLQTNGSGGLSWQTVAATGASISNGTSNINIPAASGNIQVSVAGTANVITFTNNNAYRGSYAITGMIFQASTAPGSPQPGDQWYNTTNGILFEYLNDGTNAQWVDIGSLPYPNVIVSNASAVLNNVQTTGTYYPAFISSTANGNYSLNSNTAFSANLANGALIATTFSGSQVIASIAQGTAPFLVNSNTVVANLNASLLSGASSATANTASTIALRDASGNLSANFFIGNGSQLTGVTVAAGSSIVNGTSNVVVDSGANVRTSVGGTANVLVVTGTSAIVTGTSSANNITASGVATGNANVVGTVTGNLGIRAISSTYTDNSAAASATIANAAIHGIGIPTLAATNATVTSTNAASFFIEGPPTAGTNMTITNGYALFVETGNSFFGGNILGKLANGNSSVSIPTANGNINLVAVGNTTLVITGTGANITGTLNVSSTLSVTSNANVGNLGTAQVLATANITTPQVIANIAQGTSPFLVNSNTVVANLNASLLLGATSATAATASTIALRDANGNVSGNFFIGNGSQLTGITAGSVTNSVTFNNGGTGDATGTTYNGSAARTISYNTLGASPLAGSTSLTTTGTVTTGTWNSTFTAGLNANTLSNIQGGNVSGAVGSATSATNAAAVSTSAATTATVYPTFVTATTTANYALNVVSGISANLAANSITATTFVGSLSGAATSATNAAAVSTSAATTATVYPTFVTATTTANYALNVVSGISANLAANSITATTFVGSLSGAATSATSATNASALLQNTSSATTVYPTFSTSSANGNSQAVFNTGISANLANASITATTFVGALSGAATSATTAGTVTTNAQGNITSVGTLSNLTVTGNTSIDSGTLFVDSVNDRVGIGTTTPSTKLLVYQNIPNTPLISRVQSDSTGNTFDYAAIGVQSTGGTGGFVSWASGSARANTIWVQTDSARPLILGTNDTERVRVDATGNVGIGNTAPTHKLSVTGTTSLVGNVTIQSNVAYVAPNGANTITNQMLNGGTLAWTGNAGQLFSIVDSMTGNIFTVNDVSGIPLISVDAGGNIQFAASGGFVNYGVTTAITAAGSTQGTATTLTRPINVISTVASGANGIILPTVPSGARILIVNTSANALNVYPPSGAVVNSAATNAAYSQPAGARLEYISTSTTQWYTLNATYG